ncbi:MAG: IS5 family transposase [Acidimicrobiia bacterium]
MRALEPEVVDAIWAAIEPLLPPPDDAHPLGCHRPRIADRLCFWGILIRLVTGCSWVSVEAILERRVSDTTLRARRDEWIAAGVFDQLRDHALHAYDRIISLDLREVALDGSLHKAPCGGEGTGPNPTDRAKLGWKWSVAVDANGIPVGWAIDGANRNDLKLLEPTLLDVARAGLLDDIETMHLDRGYDYPKTRAQLAGLGLKDLNIQRRKRRGSIPTKQPLRLGLRWVVEGTNSWLSNYGQLRRNTDRTTHHRHAQLCLVTALLVTAKLIDWRDRWSPDSRPIR